MENEYVIFKNGKQLSFKPRSMADTIKMMQLLESTLNRLTEHSPYTIHLATEKDYS